MIGVGTRIQRYIFIECIAGLLTVLLIILSAIVLVDFVEQFRTVGTRVDLSPLIAVQLTALKLPMLTEQTLPFAVLIGTILTYYRLNRRAELPVIRASGFSAWRFIAPAALVGLIIGVISTLAINPVGARMIDTFETKRTELIEGGRSAFEAGENGLWLRDLTGDGLSIINARDVTDGGTSFLNVRILQQDRMMTPEGEVFQFARRIDAARAELRPGFLQLSDVTEYLRSGDTLTHEFLTIASGLDTDRLLDRFASPATVGFWALPTHIRQTQSAGLNAERYVMRYHGLIAAPMMYVAMSLIGALVCLQLARLGGTMTYIAIGIGTAVGLFFLNELSASLGASGAIPPAVAAWTPSLFTALCALTFLAYREDG